MRVLICGGGVIGACIASYLSRGGAEALVVEGAGVASAASGRSGGFLALDWCDGSPLGPLARRSFALHAELAARTGNSWGYRRLDTLGLRASARRGPTADRSSRLPDWVGGRALLQGRLGTPETTAQVDPGRFTRGMLDAAIAQGARLVPGRVTDLARSADGGRVTGAVVEGALLEADAVVVAMGPWSILTSRWLPLPPVYGLKGNSLVLRTAVPVSPHALFVEVEAADGSVHTPEVFPRPDGTTYLCGLSSEQPLPADPRQVAPDAGASDALRAMAGIFAPPLAAAEVVAVQACYRPVTRDGLPLMGRVSGIADAYVATGHSVWGILNAPASGEAMAELILTGTSSSVDLRPFDPARLPRAGAS